VAIHFIDFVIGILYTASKLSKEQHAKDNGTYLVCPREHWRTKGVRFMGVKNYNVFYHVNEELGGVTVLRIFYSRRNV